MSESSKTAVKKQTEGRVPPEPQPELHLLEDIDALSSQAHDLRGTLQEITKIITRRMGTDVCSLYLLDSKGERLTLWATTGLDRTAVGKVSLDKHEGLTGLVIETREPVVAPRCHDARTE